MVRKIYGIAVVSLLAANALLAADGYVVHNLVSDLPGLADHVDKNLINPWGNGFSAASPFWIANTGTGTSTLYNGSGTPIPLIVGVPAPAGPGAPGLPTGVLFNGTPGFIVPNSTGTATKALFLFCTLNGTIAGWNAGTAAVTLK